MAYNKGVTLFLGLEDDQICNHMSREFCDGFREIGLDAQTIRYTDDLTSDQLADAFADNDTGLVLGFTAMGLDIFKKTAQDHNLSMPFLSMFVDPVMVYMERMAYPAEKNFISTLSDADAEFVRSNLPSKAGAFQLNHAAHPTQVTPWNKKDIDLFYCASLPTPPQATRTSWDSFKPGISKILNQMVECHIANKGKDLMQDVTQVLNSYPSPYTIDVFKNFFVQVDRYFRDCRRVDTLKMIMEEAPVLLAGNGWEAAIDVDHPNVTFLGRIHPTEVREYNERAKMVLNVINYYHESHERVFLSMADGAAVLSSASPFYEKSFINDKEGLFFNWGDTDTCDRLNRLLRDDDALQEMAVAGNKAFLKKHTWAHRAQTVIDNIFPEH